jgi:hypothetical protein
MSLSIKEVSSKSEIKKFIDFNHELYAHDKKYVPELYLSQKEMFDTKKYPFYKYGEVKNFLAYEGDKIVGRISAVSNPRYNEYHGSNVGFFGFFDCIDSTEVSTLLLDKASDWLKAKGYTQVIGPTNFSTNETAGLLVDGFDKSPMLMMTYNASYYEGLIEAYGFKKEMDLYAYYIPTETASPKFVRLIDSLEKRLERSEITIRNINVKDWKNEVARIKGLYNSAWDKNWGFVPFTDAEFKHLAEGLKMLVDQDFAFIAEKGDEAVGFSISLPDINEITKNFKKGRLLPFNIIKLLLNKKKVRNVRILAAGVKEEYRQKGIDAIFFGKNIIQAKKRKLDGGEASWILESNGPMMRAAEKLNGQLYKTYRLYKKAL